MFHVPEETCDPMKCPICKTNPAMNNPPDIGDLNGKEVIGLLEALRDEGAVRFYGRRMYRWGSVLDYLQEHGLVTTRLVQLEQESYLLVLATKEAEFAPVLKLLEPGKEKVATRWDLIKETTP